LGRVVVSWLPLRMMYFISIMLQHSCCMVVLSVVKMSDATSIVFGSYNCRGFDDSKKEFATHVISKVDVLFIQEHCPIVSQCYSLILTRFVCAAASGFDNS
jgi:hypothetical protein